MAGSLDKKLFVVTFLALVFGAGIASWGNLEADSLESYNRHSLLSGELARELEQRFDKDFSLQQMGLNIWTAFQYKIFKEAKKGLIVGSDGWFFSDEEFISSAEGEQALENNIEFITQASRQLASRGVALVVVLLPSKARVLENRTGRHKPSTLHSETYSRVIDSLQKKSILTVDGLGSFQGHLQPESLYLRTDTHWTAAGAALMAATTAELFYKQFPQRALSPKAFITESVGNQLLEGDLLEFLPLSPLFDQLMPEEEQIELYQTYPLGDDFLLATNDGLFSSVSDQPEVVLLGTSFSADRRWNFAGALKQALSADVQNIAQQGQGPIVPMADFLNDYLPNPTANNLKLVIWEIPERYLPVAYSEVSLGIDSNLISQGNL
ncbi:MAG: hypothetical protein P8H31_09425 [Porticoccaceae bacterium]|nr:hypothetical protein [Porticoccaceae bacterium]